MSERVTMPALGESVTEGTVTRWLKSVGDTIEVDEPLLEVSTDKVDTEIPSPVAGTLQEVLVEEDETVPVGADLAVIGEGDAEPSSDSGSDEVGDSGPDDSDDSGAQESSDDSGKQESEQEQPAQEAGDEQPSSGQSSGDSEGGSGGDSGGGEGEKVTMPALGESVTEGTVTRWLKQEGEQVEVDEPLLEVSTDKVDTEIPSPVAGTVTKILVAEDETVPVGTDLAIVGGTAGGGGGSDTESKQEAPKEEAPTEEPKQEAPKEEAPTEEPKQETPKQAPKEEPKQQAPKQQVPKEDVPKEEAATGHAPVPAGGDASAYVTPLVRKLAADNDIDLESVKGTGVGGRIRKQDVLDAAKAAKESAQQRPAAPESAPAPAPTRGGSLAEAVSPKRGTTEKMSRLRKVIATRMVESLQTSAQLTTVVEVDVTKIARLRAKAKAGFEEREGVKLSFLPFFALATVEALKVHPSLNASVEDDSVVYHPSENLGMAVDTERGLLVPVVKDAGDLNIAGLSRKIADLAERTRTNKITPDELGGGTFTLTNTGSRGALFDTPIINQPQVGILGTGAVVKRPVVVTDVDGGETIAIRSMVYLALTYDHRIVDGADAARFLMTIKERLEEGAFEV
jgi:2-oxoglutarate dehydrogenase E2 component (dihydrolipoamide succinyltransferase)